MGELVIVVTLSINRFCYVVFPRKVEGIPIVSQHALQQTARGRPKRYLPGGREGGPPVQVRRSAGIAFLGCFRSHDFIFPSRVRLRFRPWS